MVFFFLFFKGKRLTDLKNLGIILNGIVCPMRAPETQMIVKHSKLNWRKK